MDEMRDALESFSTYIASIVEQPDLDEIDHKFKGDRLSTELIRVNFFIETLWPQQPFVMRLSLYRIARYMQQEPVFRPR